MQMYAKERTANKGILLEFLKRIYRDNDIVECVIGGNLFKVPLNTATEILCSTKKRKQTDIPFYIDLSKANGGSGFLVYAKKSPNPIEEVKSLLNENADMECDIIYNSIRGLEIIVESSKAARIHGMLLKRGFSPLKDALAILPERDASNYFSRLIWNDSFARHFLEYGSIISEPRKNVKIHGIESIEIGKRILPFAIFEPISRMPPMTQSSITKVISDISASDGEMLDFNNEACRIFSFFLATGIIERNGNLYSGYLLESN